MMNKAIVFVVDNTYADPAKMAILDVWTFSGKKYPVYVFHGANLSDRWRAKMAAAAGEVGMDLRFYDISRYGDEIPKAKSKDHVSDVAYAKLFIGDLFWSVVAEEKIHVAYYFDIDILVLRDLSKLFEIVPTKSMAAIDHKMPEHYRALNGADGMYINSGVFVANLVRWNAINAFEQFKKVIDERSDDLLYNDQDVFSAALIDDIEELPLEYNFILNPRYNNHLSGKYGLEWGDDVSPAIVHFIGPNKPWNSGISSRAHVLWRDRRKRLAI